MPDALGDVGVTAKSISFNNKSYQRRRHVHTREGEGRTTSLLVIGPVFPSHFKGLTFYFYYPHGIAFGIGAFIFRVGDF